MIKIIQGGADILPRISKYMFSHENIKNGYNFSFSQLPKVPVTEPMLANSTIAETESIVAVSDTIIAVAEPKPMLVNSIIAPLMLAPLMLAPLKKTFANKPFIPFQKDKLFWCFYIILNGYDVYELNRSISFTIEKQLKIETVEKLATIKDKLKELKLKRTELEDELVNKPTISLKALYALCLIHNVSITYIYGRKYCEFFCLSADGNEKRGIIVQNEKKEDTIKSIGQADEEDFYLTKIKSDYWFIENIQKPLNAQSAYALKDLADICEKLEIDTYTQTGDKKKAKTKKQLYEEIIEHI